MRMAERERRGRMDAGRGAGHDHIASRARAPSLSSSIRSATRARSLTPRLALMITVLIASSPFSSSWVGVCVSPGPIRRLRSVDAPGGRVRGVSVCQGAPVLGVSRGRCWVSVRFTRPLMAMTAMALLAATPPRAEAGRVGDRLTVVAPLSDIDAVSRFPPPVACVLLPSARTLSLPLRPWGNALVITALLLPSLPATALIVGVPPLPLASPTWFLTGGRDCRGGVATLGKV